MNDKALLKIKFIKEVIKYQLEDKQTQEQTQALRQSTFKLGAIGLPGWPLVVI